MCELNFELVHVEVNFPFHCLLTDLNEETSKTEFCVT